MKGALVLILCMVVASIGIEVEVLEDEDASPAHVKAAAAIQTAIDGGGEAKSIALAKKAVKKIAPPAVVSPKAAAIEKIGEKAQEAEHKVVQAAKKHAEKQVDQLKAASQQAKDSAKQAKADADDEAKQAKSELNKAKTKAKVNKAKADIQKKTEEDKLAKAKEDEKKADEGATAKSLSAAKTNYEVASKGHKAAIQNVESAKDEVLAAAAAQSKIRAALKHHKAEDNKAKDPLAGPKPLTVTAAAWAKKTAALKSEAFTAHLDSAVAAQGDLAAFKQLNRFQEKLNEAKSDVREAKSEVKAKEAVAEEGAELANKADADAKFSVNRGPVKAQLMESAKSMEKTEQKADQELAVERKTAETAEQGEAQMEHSGELAALKKKADMAERQMDEKDVLARNAENAYDEANGHFKHAANEQKRKDERAVSAAELRQKKAVTAQKLAEVQLARKHKLRKEAKTKMQKAEKANGKKSDAHAEEQMVAERATKAEAKADKAKQDKLNLAKKQGNEEKRQSQEKSAKSSNKAKEGTEKAKSKIKESGVKAAEKAQAAQDGAAKKAAVQQGAKAGEKAKGRPQQTAAQKQLSACKSCHAKCKSDSCKTWCNKQWCKDVKADAGSKPEGAVAPKQQLMEAGQQKAAALAIQKAIQTDSVKDVAEAKRATDALEHIHS